MNEAVRHYSFLRELSWNHFALVLIVLVACRVLVLLIRRIVRSAAESAPSHRRLLILRMAPLSRLLIWMVGIANVISVLVEPTFEDFIAVVATVGLALAFALKDYVSSLMAGVVTILENAYQPGDWIELDGIYGEVKTIGTRAVRVVTANDTEVLIPHARLWSTSVSNASSGSHSLMCVTNFYLHPDHDGAEAVKALAEVAETSSYRKPATPVTISVAELPWGTHYKIKAFVADSREQFAMVTDLTIRGKERLRLMDVAFAQAQYAETARA